MTRPQYRPVILSVTITPDLYKSVIISVAPGRRIACIVGPRGATDEEAAQAALQVIKHLGYL